MIRRGGLAAIALAIAPQVQAFETMLRSDCRAAIAQLSDLIVPLDETAGPVLLAAMDASRVTPDGWCQIDTRARGLEDVGFDTLEWRAEDINRWTRDAIPPLAFQIRMTGLDPDDMDDTGADTDRPPLDLDATIRQDPTAGQVIVERFAASNAAGDSIVLSGVFERVFLSSPSMMQVSLGSATFKAGLMVLTLEGTHENPFAASFDIEVNGSDEALGGGTLNMLSRLPVGVMDIASQAELMAYAADLPKPIGTLDMSVASERGLGLMQVGMSMYATFFSVMAEGTPSRELDILFDGIRISADWTPAAQMAD